jgi:hypothetical protein
LAGDHRGHLGAGAALTLQLALGFALTVASIRLVPVLVGLVGWRYALVPLAAGPLAGTAAMQLLRSSQRKDVFAWSPRD